MNEKDLIYVKTIADAKSISQAARLLYISQPSLSQALRRIENEVGIPLFIRHPTGMELTSAGEKYYIAAKDILNIYNDFKIDVTYINNLESGRLIVGVANIMGSYLLPKVLPGFNKKYPNIEIYIEENSTDILEKMILEGKIDLALTHCHPFSETEGIAYDILFKDKFVLVAHKEHPVKEVSAYNVSDGTYEVDLRDIANEKFLVLKKGQGIRSVSDILWTEADYAPDIILSLKNFNTALNLTIEGMGISLLPKKYTEIFGANAEFNLYHIKNTENNFWNTVILTRENTYMSKISEEFINEVKDFYKTDNPI